MASQYLPRTMLVTVTDQGGSVTIPKEYAGDSIGFHISPPGKKESSIFGFELRDSETVPQDGDPDCVGPTTIKGNYQIHDGGSFSLFNCSLDGTWTIRIWYRET